MVTVKFRIQCPIVMVTDSTTLYHGLPEKMY
jgi:hypothetical protein